MWKAVGVSAALLVAILVISKLEGGHAGLDPKDQLAFERQRAVQRQTLLASKSVQPPALSCAATRVSEATVQTLYLVWINQRSDLTTADDRDRASENLNGSIAACGAEQTAVEDDAHRRGIDLGRAAALALLQAGR